MEPPPLDQDVYDPLAVPETFYMDVEVTGAIPPGDVISEGLEILKIKLEGLSMSLKRVDREPMDMGMAPNGLGDFNQAPGRFF